MKTKTERADSIIAELARTIDRAKTHDDLLWVLKRQTSVIDLLLGMIRGIEEKINEKEND